MLIGGSLSNGSRQGGYGGAAARVSLSSPLFARYGYSGYSAARRSLSLDLGGVSGPDASSHLIFRYGSSMTLGNGPAQFLLGNEHLVDMTPSMSHSDLIPLGVRLRGSQGHLDVTASPLVFTNVWSNSDINRTHFIGSGLRAEAEFQPHPAIELYGDVGAVLHYSGSAPASTDCSTRPGNAANSTTATDTVRSANGVTTTCHQQIAQQDMTGLGYTVSGHLGMRAQITRSIAGFADFGGEVTNFRTIPTNLDGSQGAERQNTVTNVSGQVGAVFTLDNPGRASLTEPAGAGAL